jgi:hypothetical protein
MEQSKNKQQHGTAVRVEIPSDATGGGINTHKSGQLPPGYVSVWNFAGITDTTNSATDRPGKKVY